MMASVCDQYEATGLLKPAILVSIGYKSFAAMDSLRARDYLYPAALPSDEMRAPGGGLNFNSYIEHELLPRIDKNFRTEKDNRALLGHSFGGYFVLLSLYNQLQTGSHTFKTFVSASPSLWYHDFYLNQLPPLLKNNKDELNVFVSVGGLEDSTWSVKPVTEFAAAVKRQNARGLQFESTIYSDLEHMDVAMLSFTKGLQASLNDKAVSDH